MPEDTDKLFPKPGPDLSSTWIKINTVINEVSPKSGHFDSCLSPNPEDLEGGKSMIPEKDLPVIQEAKEKVAGSQKKGGIISQPENPFGEVKSLRMFIFGDTHIRGSYPEESAWRRSRLGRLIPSNKNKAKISGALSVHGFRAMAEVIAGRIGDPVYDRELVVDLGDRSDTEATMGDIALTTLEYENLRQKLEEIAEEKISGILRTKSDFVGMVLMDGNHDVDIHNKGLPAEIFKRELYGSQVFLQNCGDEYVVLGLNTNLASLFFYSSLLKESGKGSFEKVASLLKEEYELQKGLIEEAKKSGRKIILLGHEEILALRMFGDIASSKLVSVVSGHLHKSIERKGPLNSEGKEIQRLRVGASGPVGFEMRIVGNRLETIELKPPSVSRKDRLMNYL